MIIYACVFINMYLKIDCGVSQRGENTQFFIWTETTSQIHKIATI
jgi:hypothetical protein